MTEKTPHNMPASIRQRLLNLSKSRGQEFDLTRLNYAIERLMARLEATAHNGEFVLKGAQLLKLWMDLPHRATRDLDLLRTGRSDLEFLVSIFRALADANDPAADGISFDPLTTKGAVIREDGLYQGVRVTIQFSIGGKPDTLQVDVGVGDVMEPRPVALEMPSSLGFPPVRVLA